MSRLRSAAVLVAVASAGALLTNCGGTEPNAADRAFVAAMIPHHHLGMRLLDEATTNSDDVRLRRMVFEMDAYHSGELAELDRWSSSWDVAPAADFPGDLTASDLARLFGTNGVEHDTLWLALMIRHHIGALAITDAESDGAIGSARSLAKTIHDTQVRQIDEMRSLLDELCVADPTSPGCTGTEDSTD